MRDVEDNLAEAKRRLPLPVLLHQIGFGGHAKKSACCPFHVDQRNSFSVWRNEAGRWLWKCHAGCGQGDEITFLEKLKTISNNEAIKLFKEMAGVSATPSKSASVSPPDWCACVEAFTDKHLEQLADWRGFSGEFCSWLKQNRLVGLYEGCIAFPVHDSAGNVAGIHYRLGDGSWRYYPQGVKTRPLVIGELAADGFLHPFESQWDAFAFMDTSRERSGIIISRGASNGVLVGRLLPERSTVYLWPQNDVAGEKWQRDISANTKAIVKCAKIPAPHKDLNDWTRAGATADDLFAAMTSAETIGEANEPEPEPKPKEDLPDFPVECLPPLLERQARAISELCGVPLGMSAPMVLATASAAMGKGLQVRSLPGRVTPPNLFVLVCKTSGSGGTIAFKHATAPIVGMQKALRKEFEEKEKPRTDAEQLTLASRIEELKGKAKKIIDGEARSQIASQIAELNEHLAQLQKRAGKLLYVTDVTPEKVAEMLSEQGETLAHIDSDAADALGIIVGTRYGDGKHTQESLWLKSYSGEPIVIFRKNGKPLHLVAPCMAVLFVATPDKVQELFRNPRLTSGGLLPRFLACDPGAKPVAIDPNASEINYTLPTDVSQPYEAAIFAAIDLYRLSAAEEPYEITMTQAARRLVVEDWNRFCERSNGSEDLPFEARHTENAIRIALGLHTFRHVDIERRSEGTFGARMRGHEHSINEFTIRDALTIRDWFNRHQEVFRSSQQVAVEDAAWAKIERMLRDRGAAGITPRDLYSGRRVCRDRLAAERLLGGFVRDGLVAPFERKPNGAGRPTTAYRRTTLGRY